MHIELVPFDKGYLGFLDKLWKYKEVNRYTGIPEGGIDIGLWYEQYKLSKGKCISRSEQYIILADGRPVGETAFAMLPSTFAFGNWEKDPQRPCSLMDVKLKREHWGKGIARTAVLELIGIIFSTTGALDIISIVHKNNRRGIKLYSRCGFRDTNKFNAKGNLIYILSREGFEHDKDNSISHRGV
ncbi:MAG: GNAT family N-acetyltransferase [Candidatus Methanofastidiosa archaeon]|nr:GNAT family N-acetyltransferase [Candidatus Methanofastidiosa archaeon]